MTLANLRGRAAQIIAEDDFDIDRIVGIGNIMLPDITHLSELALQWCGTEFAEQHRAGDFLIGGKNFGFGHPHDATMNAMRHLGISGVIAESFCPYYMQAESYQGFPSISCPSILSFVERWDELEIDWRFSRIFNHTQDTELAFEPLTTIEMDTIEAGGFVHYLIQKHGNQQKERRA